LIKAVFDTCLQYGSSVVISCSLCIYLFLLPSFD
jgi:hypothetical protein